MVSYLQCKSQVLGSLVFCFATVSRMRVTFTPLDRLGGFVGRGVKTMF